MQSEGETLTLNQNFKEGGPKRVFSGIQPTGAAHIGNYLGAIKNWVALQDEHEAFYCVVDLHSLTLPWDPRELPRLTMDKGAELLACGIDPERSVLFIQSQVQEHLELAWILTCVARMGELRRMVQFKEKSKGETESVGVGLFSYPVLQAADVLLYQAHGVPVGEDQRQHIELMRDLAQRFNGSFGRTFVVPEAWIQEAGARIMSLDDPTQKMSKSDARPNSVIQIADSPDVIAKKIRAAVTDSGRDIVLRPDRPAIGNLLTIYSVVSGESPAAVEDLFAGRGYGDFKAALSDLLIAALAPIRAHYDELIADPEECARVLGRGAEKAHAVAADTMSRVRERVGVIPPP